MMQTSEVRVLARNRRWGRKVAVAATFAGPLAGSALLERVTPTTIFGAARSRLQRGHTE